MNNTSKRIFGRRVEQNESTIRTKHRVKIETIIIYVYGIYEIMSTDNQEMKTYVLKENQYSNDFSLARHVSHKSHTLGSVILNA